MQSATSGADPCLTRALSVLASLPFSSPRVTHEKDVIEGIKVRHTTRTI